ncbi:MAG TPA: hypothetical protein VFO36_07435 [Nitrospiraceae bacterium]|nr:hypothetical protein [Nitrospiraceae bacterium]
MLEVETLDELRASVHQTVEANRGVLEGALEQVKALNNDFRVLKPRTITSFSMVASDGGHNKIEFNPFSLTVVRVVDSKGKELFSDCVSPATDIDALARHNLEADTTVGRLMKGLGIEHLPDLSTALNPKDNSTGWVTVYRDICEWAALYDSIVNRDHANSTIFVRDGMLRTKVFNKDLFFQMYKQILEAIERNRRDEKVDLFLVGVAKHSEVHTYYELAMTAAGQLPVGQPCFAPIPDEMQKTVYKWPEYLRPPDESLPGEPPKYNGGAMHFVRFGPSTGDRIWTVDVLYDQRDRAEEVLACLVGDARDGFPIPHYPLCLQRADANAQIAGFDRSILADYLEDAIRDVLPTNATHAVDAMRLNVDPTARRYS